MKVVVTGTRGIPHILGGVETHCEELYPRLAQMGYEIIITRRSCYITENNRINSFKGITLKDIYAPHQKKFEAIIHTFLSIVYARRINADILHIHAIGPAVMVPFARLLGLKVIITHHGFDYNREKWGKTARLMLRAGEYLGTRFANEIIVISSEIQNVLQTKYNRTDTHLIYNGVNIPVKTTSIGYLSTLGLQPGKYVVALGRFVKEKGFDLLIDAFGKLSNNNYSLVLAGDADHEDAYSVSLKKKAREQGVILTGFIKGDKLNEILSHARLFVLPSSHEGLPIALLEAMSYNLDVLVSDIPANKLNELEKNDFFRSGSTTDLAVKLGKKLQNSKPDRKYNLSAYNWNHIAGQVNDIYRKLTSRKHLKPTTGDFPVTE